MELTDFQKLVISSMIDGKVNNVETFLSRHCEFQQEAAGQTIILNWRTINDGEIGLLPKDDATTLSQLMQFLSLWQKLESAELIHTVITEDRASVFRPILKRTNRPNTYALNGKMMSILRRYSDHEIVVFPELSSFVRNGYSTAKEIARRSEEQDRKTAQKDTRRIAYWSIGLTAFVAISSTIFNWATYTKERTVMITNTNAFSDLQKVILVNPSALPGTNAIVPTVGSGDNTNVLKPESVQENK